MSDTIEDFKALKRIHREHAEKNHQLVRLQLEAAGITYIERNNGEHLICTRGKRHGDLWPSRMKWRYGLGAEAERGQGLERFLAAMMVDG